VNTGLGADEHRIQLWRPAPLLLSEVTTSSSTYTGALPARSEQAPPQSAGESSSHADYPGYQASSSPVQSRAQEPSPSKLPFTGFSSAKADFPGHRPSAAATAAAAPAPTDAVASPRLPFVGQSTAKSDYVGHSPARPASPAQAPGTPQSRSRVDLVGQSTTKADFPGHAAEAYTPSKAYFDGQTTRSARIPLQGESESRAAFAGWRLVRFSLMSSTFTDPHPFATCGGSPRRVLRSGWR